MRHAGASRSKPLRSLGMLQAPLQAALVAPARLAQRLPARQPGASVDAVDLPAIAARADVHVLAATRAKKEASCLLHRRSQSADEPSTSSPRACYTSARTVLVTVGGTAFGWERKLLPGAVPGSLRRNRVPTSSAPTPNSRRESLVHRVRAAERRAANHSQRAAVQSVDELHKHHATAKLRAHPPFAPLCCC